MDDEWVICTFWRSANGTETMHVYGPFPETTAMRARQRVVNNHRRQCPTGPLPVIRVVKMKDRVS